MEQDIKKTEQSNQEATTVGMFLKFTRQNQKKSIETVSKALCIRKIYIKAIEESDFEELAPVPYGIGFVRSYADYLGLNVERIVQCYKEEAMPQKNEQNAKPIVNKQTSITMPNLKQILIGVVLILGLYFLTYTIAYKTQENKEDITYNDINIDNSVDKTDTEILAENTLVEGFKVEEITTEENVKVIETSYEEVEENEPQELDKIVVKFNGESWIEIKDNDKVYISGIYQKGFEYELPVVPNLIFSVGRYFNVDVFINGELVKVAGPKKQTNIKLDKFLNH